ncbi:MAG: hypothetical protein H7287_13975 [Thermoleophilia bacterium]|nr:hypothetical protein [Thermoleophilia bacterium]
MPRPSHAAAGTHALVHRTNRVGASADARVSFELVGSAATELEYVDPILAARSWLANPVRTSGLPERVTQLAGQTLDRAEAHVRELDVVAGQVALDANATGVVDSARLAQLDSMTLTLNRFSMRLRDVLAEAAAEPDAVTARMDAALQASRRGGFEALVASL